LTIGKRKTEKNMRTFCKKLVAASASLLAWLHAIAQVPAPGSVDTNFVAARWPDSNIAVLYQSQDKIIIVGAGEESLIRLNYDGSLDTSFHTPVASKDGVDSALGGDSQLALAKDDKLLVSWLFDFVDGYSRTNLVRLNPDGSVDTSFVPYIKPGASGSLSSLLVLVQPDGKIIQGQVVTNYFTELVRLNQDGTDDAGFQAYVPPRRGEFGQILSAWVEGLPLPDGKLLIQGSFGEVNGLARPGIARLNSDGSVDQSWDVDPSIVFVWGSCALQVDGRILIADYRGSDLTDYGPVLLNVDGSLDTSFNLPSSLPLGGNGVDALAVQADGRVLIATHDAQPEPYGGYLYRLNSDGSIDPTFNVTLGGGAVGNILVQLNGEILISGWFTNVNGWPAPALARLHSGFNPPVFTGIRLGANSFKATVPCLPGRTYIFEASGNLTDWLPIHTNLATTATLLFEDPIAPNSGARLYRAVLQ
jgi:uncharacterized delta-60 repeat protein